MLKSITRNRARRHVVTQAVAILEIADRHAIDLIAAIEKAERPATGDLPMAHGVAGACGEPR